MSSLSTHVLDTMHGMPAANVALALTNGLGETLFEGTTNGDGRCPELPVLDTGRHQLAFAVADYFRSCGVVLPEPPFLDVVTIDFGVSGEGHYHVPLLVSPYAYSTYRGS